MITIVDRETVYIAEEFGVDGLVPLPHPNPKLGVSNANIRKVGTVVDDVQFVILNYHLPLVGRELDDEILPAPTRVKH